MFVSKFDSTSSDADETFSSLDAEVEMGLRSLPSIRWIICTILTTGLFTVSNHRKRLSQTPSSSSEITSTFEQVVASGRQLSLNFD